VIIGRPVLVPVSAHGFGRRSKLRLGVHDLLDDGEQVEGAAGEAVNPRHRDHVAGAETVEHAEKLAPVGVRTRHPLAIDVPAAASGGAKLLKLAVEGLPIGADAGIADEPFFGRVSTITYDACKPLNSWTQDVCRNS
jgi:hypothetical protein